MAKLFQRLFGRRPVPPMPDEPSPYAPVWTTGALPEVDQLLKRGVR